MQRHPLNREFTWRQPEPPYGIITDAQAQAYRDEGAFVLSGGISRAEVDGLLADWIRSKRPPTRR